MDDNTMADTSDFVQMAREFPLRTGIFTFGLPAFALVQLCNGLVHGGSLLFIGAFAVVASACAVVLAQYQVAVYRLERVGGRWS